MRNVDFKSHPLLPIVAAVVFAVPLAIVTALVWVGIASLMPLNVWYEGVWVKVPLDELWSYTGSEWRPGRVKQFWEWSQQLQIVPLLVQRAWILGGVFAAAVFYATRYKILRPGNYREVAIAYMVEMGTLVILLGVVALIALQPALPDHPELSLIMWQFHPAW